MSILDIIIITLGAIIITIYTIIQVNYYKKWKAKVKELVQSGMDFETAKAKAHSMIYKKKNKKTAKDKTPQEIEEEIFEE